jgi:hypothetical protein
VREDHVLHHDQGEPGGLTRLWILFEQPALSIGRDPGAVVDHADQELAGLELVVDDDADPRLGVRLMLPLEMTKGVADERRDRPGDLLASAGKLTGTTSAYSKCTSTPESGA